MALQLLPKPGSAARLTVALAAAALVFLGTRQSCVGGQPTETAHVPTKLAAEHSHEDGPQPLGVRASPPPTPEPRIDCAIPTADGYGWAQNAASGSVRMIHVSGGTASVPLVWLPLTYEQEGVGWVSLSAEPGGCVVTRFQPYVAVFGTARRTDGAPLGQMWLRIGDIVAPDFEGNEFVFAQVPTGEWRLTATECDGTVSAAVPITVVSTGDLLGVKVELPPPPKCRVPTGLDLEACLRDVLDEEEKVAQVRAVFEGADPAAAAISAKLLETLEETVRSKRARCPN